MNARLNHVLARKGTAVTRPKSLQPVGHRVGCRLTVTYPLPFSVTTTATSDAITVHPAPPPPPTPALAALDITPRMFTLTGRRVGGRCQPSSRLNRRHRPCTRPVMLHGTTVINGGASGDAFTFTRKFGGRVLGPGNYRLLARPIVDGIAGQQQTTLDRALSGGGTRCSRK